MNIGNGYQWLKTGTYKAKDIDYYKCTRYKEGCPCVKKVYSDGYEEYKYKHTHKPEIFTEHMIVIPRKTKTIVKICKPKEKHHYVLYSRYKLKNGLQRSNYRCKHENCKSKKYVDRDLSSNTYKVTHINLPCKNCIIK